MNRFHHGLSYLIVSRKGSLRSWAIFKPNDNANPLPHRTERIFRTRHSAWCLSKKTFYPYDQYSQFAVGLTVTFVTDRHPKRHEIAGIIAPYLFIPKPAGM
jgi:hypothetical protein